ncbi:MAG TPA: Pycsar system effector family protein, partial [Chitinophagaceae bacterium]|nr:Pycsar system effector family protein [Chitinophagaceae bacterium]
VDDDHIRQVKNCILATKYPQNPSSLLEQVICDADMIHLGKKEYWERATLIREEWALTRGGIFDDREWYKLNVEFLNGHRFHTAYCNDNYGKRKSKNLMFISKLTIETESKENNGEKDTSANEKILKKEKEANLPRGVETLFRLASSNHMRLSGMADNKAHILLSINSIIISIILSVLAKKLVEAPYLILPTILLLVVSVVSIVFAVMTTRPKVSHGVFTKEQISNREVNLLFFGNFHKMELSAYEWGIQEMMYDKEYLYKSITKDIYFLGKVLAVKYRYLNIGYMIFMLGMIASIVAFAISFLMG